MLALTLCGLVAALWVGRGRLARSVAVYALSMFILVSGALVAHETFGRERSGVDLVAPIARVLEAGMPIYSVRLLDHTLPFYLRHTTIMVEAPDELEFGAKREPEKWIPTLDRFVAVWQGGPPGRGNHVARDPRPAPRPPGRHVSPRRRFTPGGRHQLRAGSAMTLSTFLIIVAGVLLNALAQLLLKAGVTPLGPLHLDPANALSTAGRVLTQWPIVAGLGCYVVSVGVWIVALSRADVSLAYPMLSLGYVVNAIAAWYLFGELIGPTRVAGIALILAGVFVMSRG